MRAFLALCVLSLLAGCGNQAAAGTGDSKAAPAATGCDCCGDKVAGKEGAAGKEGDACCAEKVAGKEGAAGKEGDACCAGACCGEKAPEAPKKP